MNVRDKITVEITSVGMNGEGVARVDGMVVFVPYTLLGEQAIVEITQVKKAYAFGKVIKLLRASEDRARPLCKLCFKCGGCEMQHIKYDTQLAIKRNTVKNCIDRECGIDFPVDSTVPSPDIYGYRNKIQLPISKVDGKIAGGYFASNTHKAVANSVQGEGGGCALNAEGIQLIVDCFLDHIQRFGIEVYDETSHSGLIRHLVVRKVGDKFSVCAVVNGDGLPEYKAFARKMEEAGVNFSLYISSNKKRTNVIMGDTVRLLVGNECVEGDAMGVKYSVSPQSFMQVNDKVRDLIYSRVGEIIKESGISNVIDAYSGIGIMSNIFAAYCDRVYAIEIVEQAVEDARRLAKLNGNGDKIVNICGDCAQRLPELIARMDGSAVVLDPPRKGCDTRVLESLLKAKPDRIIYISCNPATLARDMKYLLSEYEPVSITPYDMFPHTKHIETLVCLKRKQ